MAQHRPHLQGLRPQIHCGHPGGDPRQAEALPGVQLGERPPDARQLPAERTALEPDVWRAAAQHGLRLRPLTDGAVAPFAEALGYTARHHGRAEARSQPGRAHRGDEPRAGELAHSRAAHGHRAAACDSPTSSSRAARASPRTSTPAISSAARRSSSCSSSAGVRVMRRRSTTTPDRSTPSASTRESSRLAALPPVDGRPSGTGPVEMTAEDRVHRGRRTWSAWTATASTSSPTRRTSDLVTVHIYAPPLMELTVYSTDSADRGAPATALHTRRRPRLTPAAGA